MKKQLYTLTIIFLLALTLFPTLNVWRVEPAYATGITRVQGPANYAGSISYSGSVTLVSTPTAGNMIVLTYSCLSTTYYPILAMSSGTGIDWQNNGAGLQKRSQCAVGSYYLDVEIWLGYVSSGSANKVVTFLTNLASGYVIADACEYSGITTSGFLDKTASSNGAGTASPATGTTATTSQADELFIGLVGAFSNTSDVSQSSPINSFALLDGTNNAVSGGNESSGYLELIASSTATANSSVTLANSCTLYAGCIATFIMLIPDTSPPTFNTITSNTTLAGNVTQITCWIGDDSGVSAWRFAWNNSGSWVNSSACSTSGALLNQRWNGTWNDTSGEIVQVQFWANDTLNNAGYSSIHTFITTSNYSLAYMLGELAGEVNWQKSVYTYYVGYQFGECSLAQLKAAIDAIPAVASATYSYVGASTWQAVLYWYVTCAKYGIENQTTIKWALDQASMLTTTGLPISDSNYFSTYDRYLLYGYYYAQKYSYQTTKWNMTTAYNTLKLSINNTYHSFRLLYGVNDTSGSYRYYDEEAETMDCFVTLYSLGVTDALTEATLIYSYLVSNYYGSSDYGYYFGYQGSSGKFECEAGGFLQLCEKLWYNYPTLTNIADLLTDLKTRFISLQWSSPQWDWAEENFPAIVLHARYANGTIATNQARLSNTLMAWSAIYGVANSLSTQEYLNMTQMLLGTGTTAYTPAWNLTYHSLGSFIGFKSVSDSATITNESTVMGMTLMALQGVVPTNTTLAIPLQENNYEDTANLGDHDLFNINLTTRTLTISLVDSGNVTFLYGSSPVNYTFTNGQGIYLIQFASDWNSITSVSHNPAGLPTNRVYLFSMSLDTTPPTYSVLSANSTVWGSACNFTATLADETALASYIFSTNNTGTWVNDTLVSISGTTYHANVTKTLTSSNSNATHPEIIQWEIWFSDSSNNVGNTGIQTLTLYYPLTVYWNNATIFNFDVGYTLAGINASLNYDHIGWTRIIYQNSSSSAQYVFVKGSDANAEIVVYQTTGILLIYCSTAGNWTHTYPLQGGAYGSDPTTITIIGLTTAIVAIAAVVGNKLRRKKPKEVSK